MAFIWGGIGFVGKLFVAQGMSNLYPIILMGQAGIIINCILGVLNLIPLPPLDGAKIVSSLLPGKWLINMIASSRMDFIFWCY